MVATAVYTASSPYTQSIAHKTLLHYQCIAVYVPVFTKQNLLSHNVLIRKRKTNAGFESVLTYGMLRMPSFYC